MGDVKPYDPTGYSWWVWAAALLALIVLVAIILIVWLLTRKKSQRTVHTIKPKPLILPNIPVLQRKYLQLIAEVETSHQQGRISDRAVHQKLSVLLRYFVHEIKGVRTPVLTLAELKMTSFHTLVQAVESYYVPEFDSVKSGDVAVALHTAREVVSKWS